LQGNAAGKNHLAAVRLITTCRYITAEFNRRSVAEGDAAQRCTFTDRPSERYVATKRKAARPVNLARKAYLTRTQIAQLHDLQAPIKVCQKSILPLSGER